MAKHKPSVIWGFRKDPQAPVNGWVKTHSKTHLHIEVKNTLPFFEADFLLSRKEARMLAKRILQCLEDTK